jgi:hypothetical protein
MQISLHSYWKVVHKLLIDVIPKEIRLCMEEVGGQRQDLILNFDFTMSLL